MIKWAGEGGKDVMENRPTNTVPDQPGKTAGPVEGPKGLDDKGAITGGADSSYDSVGPVPRGDTMISPTDK